MIRFGSTFHVSVGNPKNPAEKLSGQELAEIGNEVLPAKLNVKSSAHPTDNDKGVFDVPNQHDDIFPGAFIGGFSAANKISAEMDAGMGSAFGYPQQVKPDDLECAYEFEKLAANGQVANRINFVG